MKISDTVFVCMTIAGMPIALFVFYILNRSKRYGGIRGFWKWLRKEVFDVDQ